MSVVAVSVSMSREATLASRHARRFGGSVTLVALLAPRVAAVVVAELLPEPRLVAFEQREAAQPLRALPEVQVRDEQPRRPTMLGVQRRAVVVEGDPRLAAGDVLERQIGRVAAVAERADETGALDVDPVEERVDRDAFPGRVELGPLGDAVDVDGRRLVGQRLELFPGPAPALDAGADDPEAPFLERGARRRAGGEDGEIVDEVLAGRDAGGERLVAALAAESAGDGGHALKCRGIDNRFSARIPDRFVHRPYLPPMANFRSYLPLVAAV